MSDVEHSELHVNPELLEPPETQEPPMPAAPSIADQFTTAVMGMVAEYLMNNAQPGVPPPQLQRLDETSFAYMYSDKIMRIRIEPITDAIVNRVVSELPEGFDPADI